MEAVQETPCLRLMDGKDLHQFLRSIFKKLGVLDILFGEKHVGKEFV